MKMKFDYGSYRQLVQLLIENGYSITNYHNYQNYDNCVILRHDIDTSLEKALKLAEIEREINVSSTYFVLLTSDFYNINSLSNIKKLERIIDLGHEIGLHFDETRYPENREDTASIQDQILKEKVILETILSHPVTTVSMHRPSGAILKADLQIPNMINSYGKVFFEEFKYLSDSRRRWREPVEDIITSKKYRYLHILTHAFWYNEYEEDIHLSVKRFVNNANHDRYNIFDQNITDLPSIMDKSEII